MAVCPCRWEHHPGTLFTCGTVGGQEAGGPRGRAGAVAQLVTGLVTSRQTQDGWVVESKRENAPFFLPLSLLCSRKIFKAGVKDLALSDYSFIQNRSWGSPSVATVPPAHLPSGRARDPIPPVPWDQRRRRGRVGSGSCPGMRSQRYTLGHEACAGLRSTPASG